VRAIQPNYLTERDYPWLRALVEERERFVGRKRSEWEQRIADGLSINAPRQKLSAALRVLQRLAPDAVKSAVAPRQIRAVLFREAATVDRRVALTNAAQKLGICEQTIEESVFADLAGERRLEAIQAPALDELALRSNVELIGQWLSRALRVRLKAAGKVRAVVRHAKLMGLLCHATSGGQKDEAELEISGPFALFRHTRIYARALTSLVPRLAWCHSFRLEADCVLGAGDRLGRLVLRHGDPLFPARELPAFDSKLEERFAKGFAKIAVLPGLRAPSSIHRRELAARGRGLLDTRVREKKVRHAERGSLRSTHHVHRRRALLQRRADRPGRARRALS
jgi:predicted nuclease of restriction endonuclease-like RecB superfamily